MLPFLNLSADPENEFFADGITEDVIAQLSKIRSLKVISRGSVMGFKQREQNLREIGVALRRRDAARGQRAPGGRPGADRRPAHRRGDRTGISGPRRTTAQLTDIFAIQTDVALQIAAALRAELSRG